MEEAELRSGDWFNVGNGSRRAAAEGGGRGREASLHQATGFGEGVLAGASDPGRSRLEASPIAGLFWGRLRGSRVIPGGDAKVGRDAGSSQTPPTTCFHNELDSELHLHV